MRLTRRKNGRVVPVERPGAAPHGRPRALAPARRAPADAGEASAKYALERFHVRLAIAEGDRKARLAAQDRAERARRRLAGLPDGADRIARVNASLARADEAIRTASRAHVDAKAYAVGAAVLLVRLIDEHDVRSVAALELLGSAAASLRLAAMLRDLAFAKGPGILSATKATSDPSGRVSATLATFGDLLKLSSTIAATGRGDLATALDLEQRSRAERPGGALAPEVLARMAAVVERRRGLEAVRGDDAGASAPDEAEALNAPADAQEGDVAAAPASATTMPASRAAYAGELPDGRAQRHPLNAPVVNGGRAR